MDKSCIRTHNNIYNYFVYFIIFVVLFVIFCDTNQNYEDNEHLVLNRQVEQIYFKPFNNSVNDVYKELMDLKDFRFLSNSQVCDECTKDFLIVVVIFSSLANTKNRAAIRNTWGKEWECIKFVYLVGTTNDTKVTQMIQYENIKHRDIIQGNFVDTYRNLTYKHIMALKWVTYNCPKAKYIVKTDDDLVVNTSRLYEALKNGTWGETNFTACGMIWRAHVLRKDSKWSVTKEEFSEDYYPNYCNGPFVIYSPDVVRRLLTASRKVRYFWIDDVFVTGILAKMIGVRHVNLLDDKFYMHTSEKLMKLGPKNVTPVIYGPLSLGPDEINKVWKAMQES